ncbi:MAG: RNA 2',3'-cyclic phosphodiesterase [Candidatus Hodarchaeales archaeon]|jgi:2'-5' RNA ligase
MVRTFICVEIDNPDMISLLEGIIRDLRGYKGLRPVKSSQLHLTMKFLGEISENTLKEIKTILSQINQPSFDITLSGMGCFPNLDYMRVVWIGITEGTDQLTTLTRDIQQNLAQIGIKKDNRPFSAHLTLARIKYLSASDKNALTEQIISSKEKMIGVQRIEKFILKKSTLTPKGAIYDDLLTVPLEK